MIAAGHPRLRQRRPAGWLRALAMLAVAAASTAAVAAGGGEESPPLTPEEVRRILRHGPWPRTPPPDPSNRVWGNADAIALGEALFFDTRLSASGEMSCATCHVPGRGWTDGRARAQGRARLDRNTPSLWNVAQHRWFGWDGGADNLWSQSVKPIVNPREMAADARQVRALIEGDRMLACGYERVFRENGRTGPGDGEAILVNIGKAIAAFVGTLATARSPFDEFRDALARGDAAGAARYPAAARRGLRLFVGRGNCSVCHFGPAFTNGEFADVGVPYMVEPGRVDPGRHGGIRMLRADRLNLLGIYNDDRERTTATKTRHVALAHRNWGEFRVPGLRNVAYTAPYMHDGRLATLDDVVRHYSELPEERLHTDGERILKPLRLADGEIDDLVAFLRSLSDGAPAWWPTATSRLCLLR